MSRVLELRELEEKLIVNYEKAVQACVDASRDKVRAWDMVIELRKKIADQIRFEEKLMGQKK